MAVLTHIRTVVCFLLLGVGRVVNVFVPRTYGNLVEDLTNKRGM